MHRSQAGMALAAAVVLAATSSGCADVCEQVGRHRQEFGARQASGQAPHVVAVVPFELINEMIEPQVRTLGEQPVPLAGAGLLAQFLGSANARVESVTAGPAPAGHLGLAIVVGIEWRGQRLYGMTVDARLRPTLDPERGRIVAVLRGEDLAAAEARLDPDAAERLAGALQSGMPPMARGLVSAGGVAALASTMTTAVLTETWPMLRGWLVQRLGPVSRLEMELPDLPIVRMGLDSTEGSPEEGLLLSLWTSLPVEAGEAAPERPSPAAGAHDLAVVASGSTIAEIGNWAMARGMLPSRYDRDGEPAEDGELEAGVRWRGGRRPLEVNLWRTDSPCVRSVLGATPEVRVEGEDIRVAVSDGRLEAVEGAARFQVGAFITGMWTRAFEASQGLTRSASFSVAGQPLSAAVTAIERQGDDFHATVRLTPEAATPAPSPSPL